MHAWDIRCAMIRLRRVYEPRPPATRSLRPACCSKAFSTTASAFMDGPIASTCTADELTSAHLEAPCSAWIAAAARICSAIQAICSQFDDCWG